MGKKILRSINECKKFIIDFTCDGEFGWNENVRKDVLCVMTDIESSLAVMKGVTATTTTTSSSSSANSSSVPVTVMNNTNAVATSNVENVANKVVASASNT